MRTVLGSLRIFLTLSLLLGGAYPLLMTGVSQMVFPFQANGSILYGKSVPLASELIGQDLKSPLWFQGRMSATATEPYNPLASGGSNLSPHGQAIADRQKNARLAWETLAGTAGQKLPVPDLLLTASGSGLDPDLDLDSVLWQVPIIAHARGVEPETLRHLVDLHTTRKVWPWDPDTRVNLVRLNIGLAELVRE